MLQYQFPKNGLVLTLLLVLQVLRLVDCTLSNHICCDNRLTTVVSRVLHIRFSIVFLTKCCVINLLFLLDVSNSQLCEHNVTIIIVV